MALGGIKGALLTRTVFAYILMSVWTGGRHPLAPLPSSHSPAQRRGRERPMSQIPADGWQATCRAGWRRCSGRGKCTRWVSKASESVGGAIANQRNGRSERRLPARLMSLSSITRPRSRRTGWPGGNAAASGGLLFPRLDIGKRIGRTARRRLTGGGVYPRSLLGLLTSDKQD